MPVQDPERAAAMRASSGQMRAVVLRVQTALARTTSPFWARISGLLAQKQITTCAPIPWESRVSATSTVVACLSRSGML